MKRKTLVSVIIGCAVAIAISTWLVFRDSPVVDPPLTAKQLSRYQAGTFYRTIVNSTLQGQIEDKNWGLVTKVTLIHEGELDIIREVKTVDPNHTRVEMGMEVLAARDLDVRLNVDDMKLDLPPVAGNVIKGALLFSSPINPAGEIVVESVAEWLRSEQNRGKVLSRVDSAVEAVSGKGLAEHLLSVEMRPLEKYEGITADYSYQAGEGLVEFSTSGALSKEQEERIKNFSVFSEAYLLPDPSEDGPSRWDVNVKSITHLLVPSGELDLSGTLTFERAGTKEGVTRLRIVKGKVVFNGGDDKKAVLGSWAARGSLYYDLKTHHVTKGVLDGEVTLERRSTDHVLFEEKFTAVPSYRVVIMGLVSKNASEARQLIENVIVE